MRLDLSGKIAVLAWAAAVFGMISCMSASAAGSVISIEAEGWSDEDWGSIAMTNDKTVSTGVVIRSEASKDSEAVGYLYRGAAAEVVFKGEKWTEVRSGSVKGFVKNRYLVYGTEARTYAEKYGVEGVSANWDDVNIFADADADAKITSTVDAGSVMPLLSDGGHWLTVRQDSKSTGFVSCEDVTKTLLLDTAVSVEEDAPDSFAWIFAGQSAGSSGGSDEGGAGASGDTGLTEAVFETADYTEESSSEDGAASDSGSAAAQEDYSVQSYEAARISENVDVQALYDAYLAAQDKAMHPESDEDARIKADAAYEAYQVYLEAAGSAQAWGSDPENPDSASGSYDESASASYDESAYTESVSESYDESAYTESVSESYDEGAYTDSASESYDESAYTDSASESYDESVYTDSASESYDESAYTDSSDESYEESSGSGSSDPSNDYTNYSDLDLLAAIIWCEAGNQPYDGMVAVGMVVMNRVASSSFPNTVAEVLNQPGQFYPASSGTLQAAIAAGVNSTCYSAAQDALNGAQPVPGALYFNTSSGTTKLGDHYFS